VEHVPRRHVVNFVHYLILCTQDNITISYISSSDSELDRFTKSGIIGCGRGFGFGLAAIRALSVAMNTLDERR
jgi:hypothetical protein